MTRSGLPRFLLADVRALPVCDVSRSVWISAWDEMFLVNLFGRTARAFTYSVNMSARAHEEVTLLTECTRETRVKPRSVRSTESLSEQDARIHSLHQDACKVSARGHATGSPWLMTSHDCLIYQDVPFRVKVYIWGHT